MGIYIKSIKKPWRCDECMFTNSADECIFLKTDADIDGLNIDCPIVEIADRKTEPQTETKTETQNSNLTFEKDECAKEYEELGLKELKELIEADRKTESNSEKPNNSKERSRE